MATSWERILTAMEAEAARAAALLDSEQSGIEFDAGTPPPVDVPATWRLPEATVTPPRHGFMTAPRPVANEEIDLPEPADMPPLPDELRDRLSQLHTRIMALQAELAEAMAETEEILSKPGRRGPEPAPRAELVDRRV